MPGEALLFLLNYFSYFPNIEHYTFQKRSLLLCTLSRAPCFTPSPDRQRIHCLPRKFSNVYLSSSRACLKNAFCKMCITIYGIFCFHSVAVARYATLIQAKSPANCDAHLAESIFQTRSSTTEQNQCGESPYFCSSPREAGFGSSSPSGVCSCRQKKKTSQTRCLLS